VYRPDPEFGLCWTSSVCNADAAALPANENVSPARPSAGIAVLVFRFFFEACLVRRMAASSRASGPNGFRSDLRGMILRRAKRTGKILTTQKEYEPIRARIHIHERHRGNFSSISMDGHNAMRNRQSAQTEKRAWPINLDASFGMSF
jgi:hypothetical protein